jgi:hypothetical protein
MKTSLLRKALGCLALAITAAFTGCAVGPGGYYDGPSVGVGIGVDYYEPYGGVYGGWGPGYHVGPAPRGYRAPPSRGDWPGRSYRPSRPSQSTPSIPSRPHPSGGGRRGDGRPH